MTDPGDATRFARAIERRWSRALDRAVILSPRDWQLISDWHARGVPLALVEEAIDALAERRAGATPPRGLSYLAASVEEAWRVVREGRLSDGPAGEDADVDRPDPIASWRRRARVESDAGTELGRQLERLLARLEAGDERRAIDRELEARLDRWISPERLAAARQAAREALERYRDRMSREEWGEAVRRGVLDRLRSSLNLPRLVGRAPGPRA